MQTSCIGTIMYSWKSVVFWYCFLLFQGANKAIRMAITLEACGELSNILLDSSPANNPLECLQRCNTTKVGLQNKRCVCGSDYNEAPFFSMCNQICTWKEKDLQYYCGGQQFSIYTRDTAVENSIGVHSECVFHMQDGGLRVENCSRTLPCQCYRAFNNEWEPERSSEHSWEECLLFCENNDNQGIFAYNRENKNCPSNGRFCRSEYWINTHIYDDCIPNKCLNNGTCTNTESNFTCHCQPGFLGTICEKDVCNPNPCAHNGSCFFNGTRASCACKSGYSGEYCRESLTFTTFASTIYPSESIEETFISSMKSPLPSLTSTLTLALVNFAGYNSSAAVGTYSIYSSDLSLHITTSMATSSASAIFNNAHETSSSLTQSSATTKIMSHSSVTPSLSGTTYLSSIILSSYTKPSTRKPTSVTPSLSGTTYLSSIILSSYTKPRTRMPTSASTLRTLASTIYPSVTPSLSGTTYLSSIILSSYTKPRTRMPTSASTLRTFASTIYPSVTSKPNNANSGWLSGHAIIIVPICGVVVVLLVITIIIICVKMRKIKLNNDALESENNDTPSNSEFDYKSSYSSIQSPDNFYSSYPNGAYTYKEVHRMGPTQKMYLPRVKIRPAGSLPRNKRDYEDHAFDGRPI